MKVPDAGLAVMVQDREPLDTHSFEVVEKFLRPSTSLSQSESSPVWKAPERDDWLCLALSFLPFLESLATLQKEFAHAVNQSVPLL